MSQYLDFLDQMADEYGVPREEARAIYERETRSGRIVRNSPAGAIGHMQLMPGTAKELGVNPHDPRDNIRGGVRYYAQQRKRFGDPALAAAAYNAGPGRVGRLGRVPNIPETRNYVAAFLKDIGRVKPSQPAPTSAIVPATAPQGLPAMPQEPEDPTGGLGGQIAEWQRRSAEVQERHAASRKEQFEQGRQLIQQMYSGPSRGDTLLAISQALLAPKPYKGFAGTMHNLSKGMGAIGQQGSEAERRRAEALLRLQQSYQGDEMQAETGGLDRELELIKLSQPKKPRTAISPVTGKVLDLDTGLPVVPPPPKIGEIRKGHRFMGGDPAVASSWQKVVQ